MRNLKIAIIGAGIMGEWHARVVVESGREELVAIADINEQRAQKLAEKYNLKAVYTDYNDMLAKCDCDVVIITTPDHLHKEPVLACLRAKKHILLEKPFATTLEDAKAMVDEMRDDRAFMVNFSTRFASAYLATKRTLSSGELGNPVKVSFRKQNHIFVPTEMLSWGSKSTSMMFLGSHMVDLLFFLLERKVTQVYANGVKKVLINRGIDTYDAIQATLKFDDGTIAIVENSWILPNSFPTICEHFLQIVCEKGVIENKMHEHQVRIVDEKKEVLPGYYIVDDYSGRLEGGFKRLHDYFIDCILEGKQPEPSAYTGYKSTEVLAAIHMSVESGMPVKLPLKL